MTYSTYVGFTCGPSDQILPKYNLSLGKCLHLKKKSQKFAEILQKADHTKHKTHKNIFIETSMLINYSFIGRFKVSEQSAFHQSSEIKGNFTFGVTMRKSSRYRVVVEPISLHLLIRLLLRMSSFLGAAG